MQSHVQLMNLRPVLQLNFRSAAGYLLGGGGEGFKLRICTSPVSIFDFKCSTFFVSYFCLFVCFGFVFVFFETRCPSLLTSFLCFFLVHQIVMNLQDNMVLVENSKSLVNVLELLAESNVKGKEMNEVLAMKMHYLAFILKKCARWHNSLEGKGGIEGLIK